MPSIALREGGQLASNGNKTLKGYNNNILPFVDFFCLQKISGVKRSVRRMPRRRGASAPEAGQCGTDLQQTHTAAVLSIENDIASQKFYKSGKRRRLPASGIGTTGFKRF